MIITARLNNDDTKVYYLVSWNSQDFANTMTIKVQGNDLQKVSNDFSEITKLEIFQDGNLIATYLDLDTFTELSYLKNEYCPGESKFCDAFRLQLTKIDIVAQVQRLDEQINPVIDIDKMTLEETKAWKIKEIGDICRAEIYAGENVTLSDGTVKPYTYDSEDQQNVLSAVTLAFAAKTMGFTLDYIPFHASGQECELLDTASMVAIYMTLQLRLTRLTTKCNMLNCIIRSCENKDDVLVINWDTELPTEYQERFDEIMTTAVEIAQAMAHAMQPTTPDDSDEEPTDDEPTGDEPTDGDDEPTGDEPIEE